MAKTMTSVVELGSMSKDMKGAPKESTKLTQKDWQKVELWLKDELEQRKNSDFRKAAERKWKEIDRQVAMNPMIVLNRDGSEVTQDWHNVIELGELSRASENLTADIRRIVFPQSRFWFEPHSDIEDSLPIDRMSGEKKKNPKLQVETDGRVRAFMAQQHADFKLKDRVELSIKEALHHGTMVVEVDWDTQEFVYEAVKVKKKGSPVWQPISMWNCYLDPSPSVIGAEMFYEGSLFVERFKPRHQAEIMVKEGGDGWMTTQWKKVNKDEHKGKDDKKIKDVKVVTYWGDVYIDRADETLYYPNHKAVLMNGTIVYFAPNKTPYPPIIVQHYERLDVRDPYGTSPIVKQSPMQKLGTNLANKYMDGIALSLEPPIVYDGNDPDFVLNGGPDISPGSKTSTKGAASFKQIEIGDPQAALAGLEMVLSEMKEKLGRPGAPVGDRATKAEVVKSSQDQEVSIVNFIDKMEIALRSFLFMQHEMNLSELTEYSYYSPEAEDPDFLTVKKSDLPKAIHFEVVGARGVLGEEERSQKLTAVSAFAAGSPLFAPLIDAKEILIQMFQDAGIKNPERFLSTPGQANVGQMTAQNQQLKQTLQKVGGMLQQEKSHNQVKMVKIQADAQAKQQKTQSDHANSVAKMQLEHQDRIAKIAAEHDSRNQQLRAEMMMEMRKLFAEHVLEQQKMFQQAMNSGPKEQSPSTINIHMPSGKKTVKKTGDGEYKVTEE